MAIGLLVGDGEVVPSGPTGSPEPGLPDQDWSLRVTLVFRRTADGWELLHRHADPLVRPIPFDHRAQLARGLDS